MSNKSPSQYEDEAREHEAAGRWEEAAESWLSAKAFTIGHKRADRYYAEYERCMALAQGPTRLIAKGVGNG